MKDEKKMMECYLSYYKIANLVSVWYNFEAKEYHLTTEDEGIRIELIK